MANRPTNDSRLMTIVSMALRQPQAVRESYLRLACENDELLYEEAAEVMKWEERMGSFLLRPMLVVKEFPRPFEPGQIIADRFEILQEIGEGGMGIVYDAFDRKRNQRIAIKSAKPGFHRLLTPELEGALKVRHPNVCLVNEIHTTQTSHGELDFLTMELLEGETLAKRLADEKKLDLSEIAAIACQLCAGLAEAHRSGVLHRDFKSANVILCREPDGIRAVITDFGLACGITQAGEIGGTPRYMAPELWSGEKPSKASDIYSLGVVLYEMTAGRPPFESDVEENKLTMHPPAPSAFIKGLGPRWDRTILSCLKPLPAERPSDAAIVLADLKKKPMRKAPLLIVLLMILAVLALPQVRGWLRNSIWPQPNVRLAILPPAGSSDTAVMAGGVLQDVSDRIAHLRSGRQSVAVIPPTKAKNLQVETPEQARQVLNATHALQTSVHREGTEYVAEGSLIDLETHIHLREFSGRYSAVTVGGLTGALMGQVSMALRLEGGVPETLSPSATGPYDRGLYFLQDGSSFSAAVPLFEEALRLDPRSPLPLAGLAEAKIQEFHATRDPKLIERARYYLQSAESLNPDSVKVRLAAGLVSETTSHYENALADYRRVQDLEPNNVDAILRIAGVYDKLDMPEKAAQEYQKAIEMDPAYYEPYEYLGEFYYYHGKYPEAAEQFQNAITRAPGMYDAYTNLAAALDDLGKDDEAEQALQASLKLRETARALNSMGAMRTFQHRNEEALAYHKRAVAMDASDYVYWLNLGDSNRRLGHLNDAKIAFGRALELAIVELKQNPRSGYTRAFVGYFAAMLGDRSRAEQETAQALQLSPNDNEVIRCAVLTYEALGQRDQAIAALLNGTSELLHELDRQPDLAAFRLDSRFKDAVAQIDQRKENRQ